ncbi:MAG: nitrilase-related carbon-nitrogen hydrolase, partial [Flavobacteriales bacterium]
MKEDLKVACIQCSLLWNDPEGNRSNIAKGIEELEKDIDVAVLPEMFTTGFSMDTFGAESTDDQTTVSWMQQLAKEHNLAITGSIKVEENGQFYNRLYWVDSGQTLQYDKRHLFTFAGEHKTFTAGESLLIVDYKGWRVCPLICYDLRFPKWSRNLDKEGNSKYDLLIYVANWPGVRSTPWEVLLRARAIENQCYLVGCNRV